jgi:hypothetical protein
VLVGVRQHRQETRTLDGGVQLSLVNGTGARQSRRNDFSVFSDEITQGINVFVVDFFNASDGEAAKALALEQQGLGVALGALVFIEFFERGHEKGS